MGGKYRAPASALRDPRTDAVPYRDELIAAGKTGLAANVDAEQHVQQLELVVAERDQLIGELTFANRIRSKRADGSA